MRPLVISLATFALTTIAGAAAQAQAACDRYPVGSATYGCTCAPGATGSVWGSGPYTADSNIGAAARHAGVIGADGGAVKATAAPGEAAYAGSSQNGVETQNWGSYANSFVFANLPAVAACARFPVAEATLTCSCAAGAGTGSVWGSGPYTADSDICAAAIHAGVIMQDGGVVSVLRTDGLPSYTGSAFNGVVTRDWGSYTASITFNFN